MDRGLTAQWRFIGLDRGLKAQWRIFGLMIDIDSLPICFFTALLRWSERM
jgi:hypothetical protein